MASRPKRIVWYSPRARIDLAENYDHTAHHRGTLQAERYYKFLVETAEKAAEGKIACRPLTDFPGTYAVKAQWPKATYSHYIIFERSEDSIYVYRILHSSQEMPKSF